jgi:hypothetical protein
LPTPHSSRVPTVTLNASMRLAQQDVPSTRGIHPHQTPLNRLMFPGQAGIRRKRTARCGGRTARCGGRTARCGGRTARCGGRTARCGGRGGPAWPVPGIGSSACCTVYASRLLPSRFASLPGLYRLPPLAPHGPPAPPGQSWSGPTPARKRHRCPIDVARAATVVHRCRFVGAAAARDGKCCDSRGAWCAWSPRTAAAGLAPERAGRRSGPGAGAGRAPGRLPDRAAKLSDKQTHRWPLDGLSAPPGQRCDPADPAAVA